MCDDSDDAKKRTASATSSGNRVPRRGLPLRLRHRQAVSDGLPRRGRHPGGARHRRGDRLRLRPHGQAGPGVQAGARRGSAQDPRDHVRPARGRDPADPQERDPLRDRLRPLPRRDGRCQERRAARRQVHQGSRRGGRADRRHHSREGTGREGRAAGRHAARAGHSARDHRAGSHPVCGWSKGRLPRLHVRAGPCPGAGLSGHRLPLRRPPGVR